MNLHYYYLNFSTLDISLLQIAIDPSVNNRFVLHNLIRSYNYEMTKKELNVSKLKMCRMLLCYEYQLAFRVQNHDGKRYTIPVDAKKLCFSSIKEIFPLQSIRSAQEMLILHEIVTLQMMLYCDIKSAAEHLRDFLRLNEVYIKNSSTRVMYMQTLKYLLEFLCLYKFVHGVSSSDEEEEFKKLCSLYLQSMLLWIETEETLCCRVFVSIFLKLVATFTPIQVLRHLWDYIFNVKVKKKENVCFNILIVIADFYFTSSYLKDITDILGNIYSEDTLWLLIINGLRSPVQARRRQAIYIMKKLVYIMNDLVKESAIVLNKDKSSLTKAKLTPFICTLSHSHVYTSSDTNWSIDDVKQAFFLVYEALEEKQYHLIAPVLTHVNSLIIFNQFCNDCFNIVWLQCILEKILQHKNNNVLRWGILCISKLDETIFHGWFPKSFVNILNNTCLYECQPDKEYPEIVGELTAFLRHLGKTNLHIFLKEISDINWGPIAIFYVIHTLRIALQDGISCKDWQPDLKVVQLLMQTNLSKHSPILRVASQIELLKTISYCMSEVNEINLLASVLMLSSGASLKRGTIFWNDIVTWLGKVVTKEDAMDFIEENCMKYACEKFYLTHPKTFALMMYLFYDANLIFCETSRTETVFYNWLFSFRNIRYRPYVELKSYVIIAEVISHLSNFSTPERPDKVMKLISSYVHEIIEYFITNSKQIVGLMSTFEDYTRYTATISSHIHNALSFMSEKSLNIYASRLLNTGIDLLKRTKKNVSIEYLYGLHIVSLSQNVLSLSPAVTDFYMECLFTLDGSPTTFKCERRVILEYNLLLLQIMHQYVTKSQILSQINTCKLLLQLKQCAELGTTEIFPIIVMVLTALYNNKSFACATGEHFENIFTLTWENIILSSKNENYWIALKNLMEMIINNTFLSLPDAVNFAMKFGDKLIEEGNNIPRNKRVLLSNMAQLNEYNLIKLQKWLLNCLFHGSTPRRDQKIENHAHLFIAKHLGQYYPKHILVCDQNNDAAIRAQAVVLLHKIIKHMELDNVATVLSFIFETLENNKNKRYFNDSYLHMLKHRSMQVLLILEPVLSEESVAMLQKNLCDLILSESDQPSVKLMTEWLMIRIFANNISLHDKLWNFFAESINKRPSCTISVASIVYHVAHLLPNDNQKDFVHSALPYIAQCCLGQHFHARFYNQFILVKLYELMAATNGNDSISIYDGIYRAAMANLHQESATKNLIKMQDNFYFSGFHPFHDYSLQTIYYELPRLTSVSCNEWISPKMFENFAFKENDNHPLKLNNINSFLSETETPVYLAKAPADDAESLGSDFETYLKGLCAVQKKIDPLRDVDPSRALTYHIIYEGMEQSLYQSDFQSLEEGLIVVASFVSRPPNLGGIARTCEIFGVKTLIIENLDCVKDKEFHRLSVSAEKWINILQVKPHELQQYLLQKKDAGWSLIGVEQTANSTNLLGTKFEKKTILVLGNEKSGIPANFILLFDKCVEIPQVGVVRSLNVHVTAAICIWQYAAQHTLK